MPASGGSLIDSRFLIAEIVERIGPAVVQLLVRRTEYGSWLSPFPDGVGSGFIFDRNGYILTSHRFVKGNRAIGVILPDGRNYQGEVLDCDRHSDSAVVHIPGGSDHAASLGDSARLKPGETVVAVGSALGPEGSPTASAGVVSAKGLTLLGEGGVPFHELILTDAAINAGNGGGPLVNLAGQVIGINTTAIAYAQGMGFATAIEAARPLIDAVMGGGYVVRPWFGAVTITVTPGVVSQLGLACGRGAVVVHVEDDSSAYWAGLSTGDIIISRWEPRNLRAGFEPGNGPSPRRG